MTTYRREDLRRVTLADLSEQCDEALIHELCTQFGPVRSIVWPASSTDALSGAAQRHNFCYVDFFSSEDAQYCFEALYRTPVKLFGKELKLHYVGTELGQKEAAAAAAIASGNLRRPIAGIGGSGLHEVGAKVIVRNIDRTATEFDITAVFQQYGAFAAPPRMMRDSVGNFRGTAILSYEDFGSSDRAINGMNQKIFRDRVISVQYAELEDGSGRLHGSMEERSNAQLIREEEAKYLRKREAEMAEAQRQQRRDRLHNTSWADNINLYSRPR